MLYVSYNRHIINNTKFAKVSKGKQVYKTANEKETSNDEHEIRGYELAKAGRKRSSKSKKNYMLQHKISVKSFIDEMDGKYSVYLNEFGENQPYQKETYQYFNGSTVIGKFLIYKYTYSNEHHMYYFVHDFLLTIKYIFHLTIKNTIYDG